MLHASEMPEKFSIKPAMPKYLKAVWSTRYFWLHLVLSDLRSRWRRSWLGMGWCLIQPLCMTLLLAVVFSHLFHLPFFLYAPYILSGMIVWEFLGSCLSGGSLAFVQADAYIKQCPHPLAIYTLRQVLSNLIVLGLASLVLWFWALLARPENFGFCWLAILTFFPILTLIFWPLTTLLAYAGSRFRDIPHMIGLILQATWFISPVYFDVSMFRKGGLDALVDYNPIYHLLQIIRAPILQGSWPTLTNYFFCFALIFILVPAASYIGKKVEKKVIFYL